jgi:hypothetical protein
VKNLVRGVTGVNFSLIRGVTKSGLFVSLSSNGFTHMPCFSLVGWLVENNNYFETRMKNSQLETIL